MNWKFLDGVNLPLIVRLILIIVVWIFTTKVVIRKVIAIVEEKTHKKRISSNVFFVFHFILNTITAVVASLAIFNFIFKVDFSSFITSISIIGAAISLAFRDLLTDLVEGMVFIFSGQYNLGDTLEVRTNSGGIFRGRLTYISLRNIILEVDFDKINCRHSKIESIKREVTSESIFIDFPNFKSKDDVLLLLGSFDKSKMRVEYIVSRRGASGKNISGIRLIGDEKYIKRRASSIDGKIVKNG